MRRARWAGVQRRHVRRRIRGRSAVPVSWRRTPSRRGLRVDSRKSYGDGVIRLQSSAHHTRTSRSSPPAKGPRGWRSASGRKACAASRRSGCEPGELADIEARLAAARLAAAQGRVGEARGHLDRADEIVQDASAFRANQFDAVRSFVCLAENRPRRRVRIRHDRPSGRGGAADGVRMAAAAGCAVIGRPSRGGAGQGTRSRRVRRGRGFACSAIPRDREGFRRADRALESSDRRPRRVVCR